MIDEPQNFLEKPHERCSIGDDLLIRFPQLSESDPGVDLLQARGRQHRFEGVLGRFVVVIRRRGVVDEGAFGGIRVATDV